jgi:hypothetical protein
MVRKRSSFFGEIARSLRIVRDLKTVKFGCLRVRHYQLFFGCGGPILGLEWRGPSVTRRAMPSWGEFWKRLDERSHSKLAILNAGSPLEGVEI